MLAFIPGNGVFIHAPGRGKRIKPDSLAKEIFQPGLCRRAVVSVRTHFFFSKGLMKACIF